MHNEISKSFLQESRITERVSMAGRHHSGLPPSNQTVSGYWFHIQLFAKQNVFAIDKRYYTSFKEPTKATQVGMNYQNPLSMKPKLGRQTHIYQAFAADKSLIYCGRDLQKRLNAYQRHGMPNSAHTGDSIRYVNLHHEPCQFDIMHYYRTDWFT